MAGPVFSWEGVQTLLSVLVIVASIAWAWGSIREDLAELRVEIRILAARALVYDEDHNELLRLEEKEDLRPNPNAPSSDASTQELDGPIRKR
jgi:hypothetical protein